MQLSHRAVLANRAQTAALRPAPGDSRSTGYCSSLPLFHVFGLAAGLLQACWAGATVVLTERFDPAHVAEVIVQQRVSGVAVVVVLRRVGLVWPGTKFRLG